MSDFKVVNKSFSFSTKGEIDFVDLTDQVQEVVTKSAIKNGVVHVFAPHATGILILTENECSAKRHKGILGGNCSEEKNLSSPFQCAFAPAFYAATT
jgi:hypothetical protein